MKEQLYIINLLDLNHTLAKPLFEKFIYPWEVLSSIKEFTVTLGESLDMDKYNKVGENIWIAKSAKIYPNNYIEGPCIIGENTEVRPNAFIRGSVIVGDNCVVGNATELKNSILFDNVQVPHYNYIGDSVLGYKSHTGAGAITSNVKQDKTNVTLKAGDEVIDTKLKKFGAMLGDNVEIGCNTVMNPGTVVGAKSRVYPVSMVRGFVPENSIYKNNGEVMKIK